MAKEKASFKQQNLPAWQPILTAGTVLPTFFLIGVAFVPIGIGLLMASNTVQEIILDYTDCLNSLREPCHDKVYPFKPYYSTAPPSCECNKNFTIDYDYMRPVYGYYRLSNFYQNHRRYVRSRDDYQLLGNPESYSKDCAPFDRVEVGDRMLTIAPCGAIANSFFNDSYELFNSDNQKIELTKEGIAWASDKNIRYRNPKLNPGQSLMDAFRNTVKPPNWPTPVYNLTRNNGNTGFQNEDLIVWMRTAALPTFRKLWGIVVPPRNSEDERDRVYLPRGNYTLRIKYRYPVKMFNGRKSFIFSDTSSLGGKNNFLGIAYIMVGTICFIISAIFLFIHKKYGRLSSEMIQINQQTPYIST